MSARGLVDDLCAGLMADPELWILSRLVLNPCAAPTARAAAVVWMAMGRLRAACGRMDEEQAPS